MEYFKDFDGWNDIKKKIENNSYLPYFDSGEIWWCALGMNIGIEIDGKGDEFVRPVIVLKKYNQFGCLVIPISSARIEDKDNIFIGMIQDKIGAANLSQIRSLSSKRLVEKIRLMDKNQFIHMQKAAMEYNFPPQLSEILSPVKESSPKANIVANEKSIHL